MKRWLLFVLPVLLTVTVRAQKVDRSSFARVDAYVNRLGEMRDVYLKTIVDTLTHRQTAPQIEMARAIYVWQAKNIDYNTEGHHHPKQNNTSPSSTLNRRVTTHEGYANLFKTMCDMARINCVIIKGLAKFSPKNIGELGKWNDHTWNAIQINGTWYPVDVTWGAGYTDRRFKFYTRSYTDAWFMTDKDIFALSHFPKDKQWQMLDSPINKSNFTFAPIAGPAAIAHGIYPAEGIRGNLRGKSDTTKRLVFTVDRPQNVKSVTASAKTTKRVPAKYKIDGETMYVEMPLPTDGTYNVSMFVNDTLAYIYQAAVTKSKPKAKPKSSADSAKIARQKEKKQAELAKEKQKKIDDATKAKEKKEAATAKEKQRKEDELAKAKEKKEAAVAKEKQRKEDEIAKAQEKKDAAERKKQAEKEKEASKKKKS